MTLKDSPPDTAEHSSVVRSTDLPRLNEQQVLFSSNTRAGLDDLKLELYGKG